jgi:hypothetical protein
LDDPYYAQQDPSDSDVIHFWETHLSDDPSDWTYVGFGEVPGDLTYEEWADLFEAGVGPQPEDFVPAGEGDSDGSGGGEGEGEEGEEGEGEEGEGDEGEEGEGEEGEEGEGGEGEEGEEGEGEEGEEGEGQAPAGGAGPFEDSHAQLCEGLMDDYLEALDNLTTALDEIESGPAGEDATVAWENSTPRLRRRVRPSVVPASCSTT